MTSDQPSQSEPDSVSHDPASSADVDSTAQAMLRASLSTNPSSTSSTATTLRGYPLGQESAVKSSPITKNSIRSSSSPASRTRDRLSFLERERDPLRRGVKNDRAYADRLRREGGMAPRTPGEEANRLKQFNNEMKAARAQAPKRSTAGLFNSVCSTDLLFLIDTTGSMSSHIRAAKEQVKSIVADIKTTFLNETEVRIAVVGYKDHKSTPNVQFLDFTESADEVRSFLDELTATGGNDTPEDVLGGLQQALNATWTQQTRCIVHIADAPPHGRDSHDLGDTSDDYPEPGSEPHHLFWAPLVKQMIDIKINYALLHINSYTDRMAFNFLQKYHEVGADCSLHSRNKYFTQANALNPVYGSNAGRSRVAGLIFEETELGVRFNDLRHLVVKMVTTSASRTAVRLSGSGGSGGSSSAPRKKAPPKGMSSGLGAIAEDGDAPFIEEEEEEISSDSDEDDEDLFDGRLENIPPQWEKRGWLNESLVVEGFSPDVVIHGAKTLDDMMEHDDNIKMSVTELAIHKRSRPFAQGAMRHAFYARTAESKDYFVVKSFKRGGKGLPHLAEDMRCQALCKAFALEFNALAGSTYSLDFIVSACLKGSPGVTSTEECLSLEPFISGNYVKYNNNSGYVNMKIPEDRFNQAAQAFSHFTYERSKGRFLVSDLQGVGDVLTDPAIHTLDPERFKLIKTNLGEEGFKFFFATHVCNLVCRRLGLKSNASMVISGEPTFRTEWPTMDDTVCCSNKLCGKIVRLSSSKKTSELPGYHWCDSCYPQLKSSKIKRACIEPGRQHKFEISLFFYESQGQRPVRTCHKHRDAEMRAAAHEFAYGNEDEVPDAGTSTDAGTSQPRPDGSAAHTPVGVAVGDTGKFWNKLKFARRKTSIAASLRSSRSFLINRS